MALTEYGNIIVFCYGRDSRALCRYSINGQLLADERSQLKDDVTDMKVYGEYIVTGGNAGRLSIRDLHRYGIYTGKCCLLLVFFVCFLYLMVARYKYT